MAKHNITGCIGERIAVDYFRQKGYVILYKNWRHGRNEIDIIATSSNTTHFIEVKTRSAAKNTLPEHAVNVKKLKRIMTAATVFLEINQHHTHTIQFDILAIILKPTIQIRLIEDVYIYAV